MTLARLFKSRTSGRPVLFGLEKRQAKRIAGSSAELFFIFAGALDSPMRRIFINRALHFLP